MQKTPMWRRYLRFFGSDVAEDVRDELQFHLESKFAELVEQGWTPEAARAEAVRQFGDVRKIHRTCTAVAEQKEERMKKIEHMTAVFQDVKSGARQLRQSIGTTTLALSALAIGMGVVTAVFSVVYAVVLRPLPFPSPERLVTVWSVLEGTEDVVTPRNFDAWRREAKSFERLGAMQPTTFTLSRAGNVAQIPGAFASADYFRVFGIFPELGRTFTAEEDRAPRRHLVVLSHRLWQERFGGKRDILGSEVYLNREAFTVIGVMPASFSVRPGSEEVWAPLALSGQEMNWTGGILNVAGRLKTGTNRQQAQAEMNVLARHLAAQYPDMNRNRGIRVGDYAADLVGDLRSRLFVLLGAVGFVLLIACANVANLLLARSAGRKQELAVRSALGANRSRIVRQLLTESMLVGLAAAALGLLLAQLLIDTVRKLNFDSIPRLEEAGVNGTVFLFALFLALASTLIAGLLPAVRAAQVDIQSVLRNGGRGAAGAARDLARSVYIAGEVALALMLLIGAGLLIETAITAEHIQPGFSPRRLVTGRTALPMNIYKNSEQVIGTYRRILENLGEQPGVESAALSSKVPLSVSTVGLVLKQNSLDRPLRQDYATELRYVSSGYLATMQIPLLKGRDFSVQDKADSAQVVMINKTMANHLFPTGAAVGQLIRVPELEGRNSAWEVVGVVADVRSNGIMTAAPPVIYVPFTEVASNPWHWVEQSLYLVARTRSDSMNVTDVLKRSLSSVDPELPLGDVRTMEQRLASSAAMAHFYTRVLTALGACGLLLTVAGIYGVVSYFAGRQRAEIGIRLALGSSKGRVLLLVIRQGMRPVAAGLGIGMVGSLMTSRLLAGQVYGANANVAMIMLLAGVVLAGVAVVACYLPARQAAGIDPMVALRTQ
ncbi:MAG TPA: ABC transporter permease [Bryobacteraceae bacterium]|nr:ABC transporter permease [Bryobacteraceae bacterium]